MNDTPPQSSTPLTDKLFNSQADRVLGAADSWAEMLVLALGLERKLEALERANAGLREELAARGREFVALQGLRSSWKQRAEKAEQQLAEAQKRGDILAEQGAVHAKRVTELEGDLRAVQGAHRLALGEKIDLHRDYERLLSEVGAKLAAAESYRDEYLAIAESRLKDISRLHAELAALREQLAEREALESIGWRWRENINCGQGQFQLSDWRFSEHEPFIVNAIDIQKIFIKVEK